MTVQEVSRQRGMNTLLRRTDRTHFESSGYLWPMLVVILLVMGLIGGVTVYHHYEMSRLDRYPIRGVSVTQQDGYVDFFSLAKTGQKFVYIRASQGAVNTDDNFNDNYQRAEGSGLKIGVYHVFSFSSNARQQFNNFQNQVAGNIGTLPIAVQVTRSGLLGPGQIDRLKALVQMIRRRDHKSVILWTSNSIAHQLRLGIDWIDDSTDRKPCLTVLNPKETLNLNGQDNLVTQFVFNDGSRAWRTFSNE